MISDPRAAGWYEDPRNEARFRWWDGENWTDWTDSQWHAKEPTGSGPVEEPPTDEAEPGD